MPGRNKGERGQIIVFMAVAVVGLFGFAALALDGGNLYTEQRRAQAAADNAVMAAAFSQMSLGRAASNTYLEVAATDHATLNGFTNDGSTNVVRFYRPPLHGPYAGDANHMEVHITQHVQTALAHLFYGQNPVPLSVYAVAFGRPATAPFEGYAIAALKGGCSGESSLSVEGNGGGSSGGTFLYAGGVFVNGGCSDALEMTGGNVLYTDGGPIDVVGGAAGTACTSPGVPNGCNFYPPPAVGVDPVNQDPLADTLGTAPPPCGPARVLSTEMANGAYAGGASIRPGSYTTLNPGNSFKDTLLLQPGIYCLTGGTMSPGGGNISGTGVLIYLTDAAANIDASGGSTQIVSLSAPTLADSGCAALAYDGQDICSYLNIVVYKIAGTSSCEDVSGVEIDFTGQSQKIVTGLIYAPNSMVRYGGQGGMTMVGQTIAACIKFNGNGRIEIYYDEGSSYVPDPAIRLDQ
jgi:hypothetical protein